MKELLAIAFAGALGTLGRYSISRWAYHTIGPHFAYGTLVVNVTGCFLLGFLMHVGMVSEALPRTWKLALTTGFLGAFTTFSTFGYDTVRYVENGTLGLAAANVAANVTIGLLAAWAGLSLARTLLTTV